MGALLEISNIDFEELTKVVITRAAAENKPQGDVLKEELLKRAKNQVEIWLPIKGYEGMYKISNYGNVSSIQYGDIRYLKSRIDNYGYNHVALSNKGKVKEFKVHRLVAEAFLPNPFNKKTVNHIDGNKLNNNVSNLEWATSSEQMFHAYNVGLKGDNKKLKTQPASMSNEHVDIINTIIAPGENIDNGQVYSEATGETIRDLI